MGVANYAQLLYQVVLPELKWPAFQTMSFQFRNGLCPVCHTGSVTLRPAAKYYADNPSDLYILQGSKYGGFMILRSARCLQCPLKLVGTPGAWHIAGRALCF